jgi:hypothetical protein
MTVRAVRPSLKTAIKRKAPIKRGLFFRGGTSALSLRKLSNRRCDRLPVRTILAKPCNVATHFGSSFLHTVTRGTRNA